MAEPKTGREESGSAAVSLFTDEVYGDSMVVPTDEDMTVRDLGELVSDRIVSNGKTTLPDPADRPAKGEREELGTVYWDENGIPTRLVRENDVITFTESGGIDGVEEQSD